jgi:hypothetical protein
LDWWKGGKKGKIGKEMRQFLLFGCKEGKEEENRWMD